VDETRWRDVETYLDAALLGADPILDAALRDGIEAGLPQIQVTPSQGKLLWLLAVAAGARRILEIGTLAGYSTIWLGRAVGPGGRVVTLEANPRHAEVARRNLERAGLGSVVEIRVGLGVDLLAALGRERVAPFDLVFVDADKEHNAEYVEGALRLSRAGTLIVVDNVVRGGRVIDAQPDPDSAGVRRMFELIAREPRLDGTAVQTVGAKGYDGFAVLRVKD
jgi:predicted O-methyltransferase YrrM